MLMNAQVVHVRMVPSVPTHLEDTNASVLEDGSLERTAMNVSGVLTPITVNLFSNRGSRFAYSVRNVTHIIIFTLILNSVMDSVINHTT